MLIKIFPTTPNAHSNSTEIFSYNLIEISMKTSFNIQELLHHRSKHHGTKPMHPSLKAFQRHQEHNLKHPNSVNFITKLQNKTKQTTWIHRYIIMMQFFFKNPKLSFKVVKKSQTLLFRTPIVNEPMFGFQKLFPMNIERLLCAIMIVVYISFGK